MHLKTASANARHTVCATKPGEMIFRCNICGEHNRALASTFHRESGACAGCSGVVRFRSVAAVLTQRLFGTVAVLDELTRYQNIRGIGMSDAECYASRLQSKFDYTNTFFHRDPFLDIASPDKSWLGSHDFIVSSDVFEHVASPVQPAFDNMQKLLKPGGVVIFSVPFSLEMETREHFPHLHEFSVVEESPGTWVLNNVTSTGETEQFRKLIFHGGPGTTLEMRVFSLSALKRHFAAAGFVDFRVHNEADFENGIFWPQPWGITISALSPQS